jgi:hypothetical protein
MRALLVVLAACGGNIRLGDEPPDASSVDAPHGAFTAGPYSASFLDPAQVQCDGTLAGHEADFSTITRATSSFVDGAVQLQLATDAVIVSGDPIATGFAQPSVTLAPDPQARLWTIGVAVTLGGGPDATQAVGVGLALDSSTASSPTGIQGEIARVFATANNDGQCSVTFGALLVSN